MLFVVFRLQLSWMIEALELMRVIKNYLLDST